MEKIISLFQRNYDGDRLVRDEVVPGAEWVIAGEGVATRKWDGTACLIRDGKIYKRYTLKPGRTAPRDFDAVTALDSKTGEQQGWVPVGDGPEDAAYREAFQFNYPCPEGSYELLGPKIQGNPERKERHCLVRHGLCILPLVPVSFDGLERYFAAHDVEGIVWHHPNGRMVKIKGKDFGIKRPCVTAS
jgi:hypothetical protein